MIEKIYDDLYRIEIPLIGNPLKSINSYVIKSDEKNLIIDTGMNKPECKQALDQAIDELEIDLNCTDILITHLHADHAGLISYLSTPNTKIYGSSADTGKLMQSYNDDKRYEHWDHMANFLIHNGFKEGRQAIKKHPGYNYSSPQVEGFTTLEDQDILDIGRYRLKIIITPGHTTGHICLYDEVRKILFSGDHILSEITPNISLFWDNINPLQDYLASLGRVYGLEVKMVLPAHRSVFNNHRSRISELIKHHQNRCDEIIAIIGRIGTATAYDTAAHLKWDLQYKSWDDFPIQQKLFALGEASAHLKYLEELGKINKSENNGVIVYSLNRAVNNKSITI